MACMAEAVNAPLRRKDSASRVGALLDQQQFKAARAGNRGGPSALHTSIEKGTYLKLNVRCRR